MAVSSNLAVGGAHFPETLETSHPVDIVRWAVDRFGIDQIVVTTSFKDAVLAHVASTAAPGIQIILLDTHYLFAETLWYAQELRRRLDLNLKVLSPDPAQVEPNMWQTNHDLCCQTRKVEPLRRALQGRQAWITGVRRQDGPSRSNVRIAAYDLARNVTKINPLAAMSDSDLALYQQLYELPENPLASRGYPSIGCWPCTRPVADGEDRRGGRWAGSAKTECGLHQ